MFDTLFVFSSVPCVWSSLHCAKARLGEVSHQKSQSAKLNVCLSRKEMSQWIDLQHLPLPKSLAVHAVGGKRSSATKASRCSRSSNKCLQALFKGSNPGIHSGVHVMQVLLWAEPISGGETSWALPPWSAPLWLQHSGGEKRKRNWFTIGLRNSSMLLKM